jgi:hypothetical protein
MPPASIQPAICLALFIKPDTVSIPGGQFGPPGNLWLLHGDGRDFNSNSDPGASRGYLWISTGGGFSEHQSYGGFWLSHMNKTGYVQHYAGSDNPASNPPVINWVEPSPRNAWYVSPGPDDGEYQVVYDLVLGGILENIAPHINGTIRFWPTKTGYGAVGWRDGFPWAEAYYWDGKGHVQTIFQRPALDNPLNPAENLNAIENPISNCGWNWLYHGRDNLLNKDINQGLLHAYPQIDYFSTLELRVR